jgi:hypothetical protein
MGAEAARAQPSDAIGENQNTEQVNVFVRVKDIKQLFNSLYPSPFNERDLDPNAASFIVDWVRGSPKQAPVTIEITLPEATFEESSRMNVGEAINNFFTARVTDTERELKELFAIGRRYLLLGLFVILACLFASQAIREWPGSGPWKQALQESFLIVGWVANWKPIETFLYDWQPIVRRRRLYKRLARANVRLTAMPER